MKAPLAFFGLTRNVGVLAASLFGLSLGEEIWRAYLPKYVAALGASGVGVGVFASCQDLLDGLYQYPGGWIADRLGRRRALMLFTLVAMGGYLTFALAGRWPLAFVGLAGVMAWKSGAFPTTFAVIGDALPAGRRAIAFSVQSILVRVPRVIGAPAGGLLIAAFGVTAGVRVGLAITLVLAAAVWLAQLYVYREPPLETDDETDPSASRVLTTMPRALKRLLVADCLVRVGEGIATAFIVLYVMNVLGVSAPAYGTLYAIQQTVAILLYLPTGKLADLTGRKPLVALTFAFFALFPLAVRLAHSYGALVAAFAIGGMKEMGEPARKSLIVDLADPSQRGRAVGVYYTIRNLLVVPAGTLGGLLWQRAPHLPLETAFAVGLVGVATFALSRAPDRS